MSFIKPCCCVFISGDNRAFTVDVSQSDSVNSVFNDIQNAFGQVPSCIINCAGITRDSLLLKMDEKDFDFVLQVNLKVSVHSKSVFHCNPHFKFVLRHLVASGRRSEPFSLLVAYVTRCCHQLVAVAENHRLCHWSLLLFGAVTAICCCQPMVSFHLGLLSVLGHCRSLGIVYFRWQNA